MRFYPLERVLLDEVVSISPDCYKDNLRKQINCVNKIQRHSQCKEVNLYRIVNGDPSFDKCIALPYDEDEHLICIINFTFPCLNCTFNLKIWSVKGFIFSLTFDKSPKRFLKHEDVVIKKVTSNYSDIVKEIKRDIHDKGDSYKLERLLGEHIFTNIRPPISILDKHRISTESNRKLPKEYIEIISYADGFEIDDWIVHGHKQIRQVVTQKNNYLILAETDDGYLATEEDAKDDEIYFLRHDQEPVLLEESFIEALKKCIGRIKGDDN
jgi:hypothetical protein